MYGEKSHCRLTKRLQREAEKLAAKKVNNLLIKYFLLIVKYYGEIQASCRKPQVSCILLAEEMESQKRTQPERMRSGTYLTGGVHRTGDDIGRSLPRLTFGNDTMSTFSKIVNAQNQNKWI